MIWWCWWPHYLHFVFWQFWFDYFHCESSFSFKQTRETTNIAVSRFDTVALMLMMIKLVAFEHTSFLFGKHLKLNISQDLIIFITRPHYLNFSNILLVLRLTNLWPNDDHHTRNSKNVIYLLSQILLHLSSPRFFKIVF